MPRKLWFTFITLCAALVAFSFVNPLEVSLKEVFEQDFYVGAALNSRQVRGQEPRSTALIVEQFNTITPENLLKWGPVHPQPDVYNFAPADDFVSFGERHGLWIVGHNLIWHQQTPDWVFEDASGQPASADTLLTRMRQHIATVAGRYRGKIDGWDVVNEALEDDGSLRQTPWLEILGEDYLAQAFIAAHEADPAAQLYYNDYNLWKPAKRAGAVRLVQQLLDQGIPVAGIGMQGHYGIDYPALDQIEASILAFADLGVQVMITELDVDPLPNPSRRQGADIAMTFETQDDFNPYAAGLPDSVAQKMADRYASLFALFHRHRDQISRVTFWGVTDGDSWLNNWPIEGQNQLSAAV